MKPKPRRLARACRVVALCLLAAQLGRAPVGAAAAAAACDAAARGRGGRRACGAPSLAEDFVYFNCAGEYSYALGAQTGEERWKLRHAPLVTSAPVISDGVIHLLRSDGYVCALR